MKTGKGKWKTILCITSASSGIGSSGDLLADLAGSGDWQDGHRFSGGASDADITDWVNSLGL